MKIQPSFWRLVATSLIGLAATVGLHAQEATGGKPRAFYISEFVVTDREGTH
jgi:hypothetical protein